METPRPHLFGLLAGLLLAAGIAFAALIVTGAWTRIAESQVITVTGSSRKNVTSDLIIWRAAFMVDSATLLAAQKQLAAAQNQVEAFLERHQIKDYELSPVQIRETTGKTKDEATGEVTERRTGYRLTRAIEIRSAEVARVTELSNESSELLEQDVAFATIAVEYLYTKVSETKIEMMAEATRDARARAEQIATQGGRQLKGLRQARMGVVQINPLHGTATSWEGNNDTTSKEKTITTTVNAVFSLK